MPGKSIYLRWFLVDASGLAVASGRCGDGRTAALAGGSYRLIMQTEQEAIGTYQVAVLGDSCGPELRRLASLQRRQRHARRRRRQPRDEGIPG